MGVFFEEKTMQRFRSFLPILMLVGVFLIEPFCLPTEALAQSKVLSPAEISEYTVKLEQARHIQAQIAERVACIEAHDTDLTSRSDSLQQEIGALRRREQVLASELATRREQYEGFRNSHEAEQANYARHRAELEEYRYKKWAQEEAVRRCEHEMSFLGFLCGPSLELAKLVGAMESVEGKIQSAERQAQIASDGMINAQQQLDKSQEMLAQVQQQLELLTVSVHQTENEIQALKTTLSTLRTEDQQCRNLLDEFTGALVEARAVDTEDARASTARKVARISVGIDAIIARIASPANPVLPDGWRRSCSSQ